MEKMADIERTGTKPKAPTTFDKDDETFTKMEDNEEANSSETPKLSRRGTKIIHKSKIPENIKDLNTTKSNEPMDSVKIDDLEKLEEKITQPSEKNHETSSTLNESDLNGNDENNLNGNDKNNLNGHDSNDLNGNDNGSNDNGLNDNGISYNLTGKLKMVDDMIINETKEEGNFLSYLLNIE